MPAFIFLDFAALPTSSCFSLCAQIPITMAADAAGASLTIDNFPVSGDLRSASSYSPSGPCSSATAHSPAAAGLLRRQGRAVYQPVWLLGSSASSALLRSLCRRSPAFRRPQNWGCSAVARRASLVAMVHAASTCCRPSVSPPRVDQQGPSDHTIHAALSCHVPTLLFPPPLPLCAVPQGPGTGG